MKKLNIIILMLFSQLAIAQDSDFIFTLKKDFYINSIKIEEDIKNNPNLPIEENKELSCGSATQKETDLKPTEDLCINGIYSNVITSSGIHQWSCSNDKEEVNCSVKQLENTLKHNSCKAILNNYPQFLNKNGVYQVTINGNSTSLYCNMTYEGGGWSLIVAQFENDSATWNEGIQSDYDPSLISKKGFALNSNEIPSHSNFAISHSQYNAFNIPFYFNYVYTTGNIPMTLIKNNMNVNYYIHRSSSEYYGYQNPDTTETLIKTTYRANTLAVDKTGGVHFSYAFSTNDPTNISKGYSYNGQYLQNTSETGAWLVWIR